MIQQKIAKAETNNQEFANSLERPGPINLADIFHPSAIESFTAEPISEATALSYAPVWRAVRLLCFGVAKTNMHYFKTKQNGDRERDKTTPLGKLFSGNVNSYMTSWNFFQQLVYHLSLNGNAYAAILREAGRVVSLMPIRPDCISPVRANGQIKYVVQVKQDGETKPKVLEPDELLHFRIFSNDGIIGISPLDYAKNTIGLGLSITRWESSYFKNGTRVSAAIEVPIGMKQDAKTLLQKVFTDMYGGAENAFKVPVLDEGSKLVPFSGAAKDTLADSLMQLNIKQVANIFDIPPHKLGDDTKTSYNSIEQENQSFLNDTLDPYLVCIESEVNSKLNQDADSFFEFERKAWLRSDAKTQAEIFNKALSGAPWMTVNEVRGSINKSRIEGGDEDIIQYPTNNFTPEGEQSQQQVNNSEDPKTETHSEDMKCELLEIILQDLQRIFKRSTQQIKRYGESEYMKTYRDKIYTTNKNDLDKFNSMALRVFGIEDFSSVFSDTISQSLLNYSTIMETKPKGNKEVYHETLKTLETELTEVLTNA